MQTIAKNNSFHLIFLPIISKKWHYLQFFSGWSLWWGKNNNQFSRFMILLSCPLLGVYMLGVCKMSWWFAFSKKGREENHVIFAAWKSEIRCRFGWRKLSFATSDLWHTETSWAYFYQWNPCRRQQSHPLINFGRTSRPNKDVKTM